LALFLTTIITSPETTDAEVPLTPQPNSSANCNYDQEYYPRHTAKDLTDYDRCKDKE